MIDHMGITVSDYAKAKAFYDAVFATLGGGVLKEVPLEYTGGKHVTGYGRDHAVFWLHEGASEKGSHYAFSAENRAQVRAFQEAALRAGGTMAGRGCARITISITTARSFMTRTATMSRRCVMRRSET